MLVLATSETMSPSKLTSTLVVVPARLVIIIIIIIIISYFKQKINN